MKTKLLLAFLFFCFAQQNKYACAQITFQKTYNVTGTGGTQSNSVQQTNDGGYIIAGTKGNDSNIVLIRTNPGGDTLWTKTFRGTNNGGGHFVQQTSDGGFILIGVLNGSQACLIKTDANGDSLWTRTFNMNIHYGNTSSSFQQTDDGGYIIVGHRGMNRFGVIKTDSNGNLMWAKDYAKLFGTINAWVIRQTDDGGYIISGEDFHPGGSEIFLVKTNNSGNILWQKYYTPGGAVFGGYVEPTNDNGYILAGTTNYSNGIDFRNFYLVKTDSIGSVAWSKTYGGPFEERCFEVHQTNDNGYILVGWRNMYLVKTDDNGNLEWSKTYGGPGEIGRTAKQTSDGGYIITGASGTLVKTDSIGNSGCSEANPATLATTPFTQAIFQSFEETTGAIQTGLPVFSGGGGIVNILCQCIPPTNISITSYSTGGCQPNTIYTGYGAQSITLTANATGAVSYLWSTGESTQSIFVTAAGAYSVTAYDASGCASAQTPQSQITINVADARCGNDRKKIMLCHVPDGNSSNAQFICIAPAAVAAHLALHAGDCVGSCSSSQREITPTEDEENEIIIEPNPATSHLTIWNGDLTIESVEIYSVLGEKVFSLTFNPSPEGEGSTSVDVSKLAPGIYFVKVKGDPAISGTRKEERVAKFVKQ